MNKERFLKIVEIAKRAEENKLLIFDRFSLIMDIECADEIFYLRLDDFLNAENFDFVHDIYGIQNNLNRQKRMMENCFLPRFSTK